MTVAAIIQDLKTTDEVDYVAGNLWAAQVVANVNGVVTKGEADRRDELEARIGWDRAEELKERGYRLWDRGYAADTFRAAVKAAQR